MLDLIQSWNLGALGWTLAILSALLVGYAKTGIAGVGILIVPLMAEAFPAKQSPGILLPMLVAGDILAVGYYNRHAIWRHLLRPLPWAIGGILLAYVVLRVAPPDEETFRRFLGGLVLLCLLLTLVRERVVHLLAKDSEEDTEEHVARGTPPTPTPPPAPQATQGPAGGTGDGRKAQATSTSMGAGGAVGGRLPPPVTKTEGRAHPVFAALIGLTGGFATMAANAAGPIWILYLVALGLPRYAFIGTGAWFFLILNVFKLPFQAGLGNLTPAALAIDLALLPAILVGAGLGILTVKRIDESLFAGLVKGLAVLASLKLLIG